MRIKAIINYQYINYKGTSYTQGIRLTEDDLDKLEDAINYEINSGLPNKKNYICTNGYEIFLKPLVRVGNDIYLNQTQLRFLSQFIVTAEKKNKLFEHRNSYLFFK